MKYLKNFSETVDYPNFKLDVFRSLKTFAKRQKYCNDTLEASFKRKLTDDEYQLIHNSGDRNPFVERITGLISDNNLHIKALSDINKYGEVNREGDVGIVVKDYGVTDNYLKK